MIRNEQTPTCIYVWSYWPLRLDTCSLPWMSDVQTVTLLLPLIHSPSSAPCHLAGKARWNIGHQRRQSQWFHQVSSARLQARWRSVAGGKHSWRWDSCRHLRVLKEATCICSAGQMMNKQRWCRRITTSTYGQKRHFYLQVKGYDVTGCNKLPRGKV